MTNPTNTAAALPAFTGYAATAVAILTVRIGDDGRKGVSFFSTKHEPTMCRAVRRLIKLGVFARVEGPRGEIAVTAGPRFLDAL